MRTHPPRPLVLAAFLATMGCTGPSTDKTPTTDAPCDGPDCSTGSNTTPCDGASCVGPSGSLGALTSGGSVDLASARFQLSLTVGPPAGQRARGNADLELGLQPQLDPHF